MNNNKLTASQMAKELTIKTGRNITVAKVQNALLQLDYIEKNGRRYVPTAKGERYSEKVSMLRNGYNVPFYKWDKSLIYEIAQELED